MKRQRVYFVVGDYNAKVHWIEWSAEVDERMTADGPVTTMDTALEWERAVAALRKEGRDFSEGSVIYAVTASELLISEKGKVLMIQQAADLESERDRELAELERSNLAVKIGGTK